MTDANFQFHESYKDPVTKRTRKHVYLMDGKYMTGVTTVLSVIAKPALIQWAADMACDYIRDKDSHTPETLAEARTAHAKKKEAAGTQGTDCHALVEQYVKKCIMTNIGKALAETAEDQMLQKFIEWAVANRINFLESEKKVYSKDWFVAGTFDFSFEKDGKRYIGDLKTMKKVWDRVPFFQTAAYRKMSVEMGEAPYDGSCIVNISKEEGHELTDHWSYDWEGDQKAFESALFLYRQLNEF